VRTHCLSLGQLRADPATQSVHDTFHTPPSPFHDSVARPVPVVTTGSPSSTRLNTQMALDRVRLVQPCEWFMMPTYGFQGAPCRNSPEAVMRIAYGTSRSYASGPVISTVMHFILCETYFSMITLVPDRVGKPGLPSETPRVRSRTRSFLTV